MTSIKHAARHNIPKLRHNNGYNVMRFQYACNYFYSIIVWLNSVFTCLMFTMLLHAQGKFKIDRFSKFVFDI